MPKPEAEQQMKLAADVMDQDREVLRALAGRTEDMLAISAEKATDRSTPLRPGPDEDTARD
jgi:hypothetical protein